MNKCFFEHKHMGDIDPMNFEKRILHAAYFISKLDDKEIVILPYGKHGKRFGEILFEKYGIKPVFYLDNYKYDNENIYAVDFLSSQDNGSRLFFVTTDDFGICESLTNSLLKYIGNEQIFDIFHEDEKRLVLLDNERVHLDFLCPGFQKCGTTSLFESFKKNSNMFLPQEKETFFICDMNVESHEAFKRKYSLELTQGKIVGGIEPRYMDYAKDVYEYFGSDLKLFFCMANPMKATVSNFKMAMRDVPDDVLNLLRKHDGEVNRSCFEEWLLENYKRCFYIDYINEYLKYFSKDKMRFIISEEMYSSPLETMNDLQEFIGINTEERISCDSFPKVNVHNNVTVDYPAAIVNNALNNAFLTEYDSEIKLEISRAKQKYYKFTTTEMADFFDNNLREKVAKLYAESVSDLEMLLGRSLKGIWY